MTKRRFTLGSATAGLTALMLGCGSAAGQAQPQAIPATAAADAETAEHGPRLTGDVVTIPLVFVKGFPFVESQIDGTRGKLMFDLGSGGSLTVDSHTVSLPSIALPGKGFFGSGQTYTRVRFPAIDSLTLASGLRFTGLRNIPGNPGLPIEQDIAPDFIGWLGARFFDGYVVKIDYGKAAATFYAGGLQAALKGERVLGRIALGNHGVPNLPTFHAAIGDKVLLAAIDTGTHNNAWLKDDEVAALMASGALRRRGDGYELSGVTIGGVTLPTMTLDITPGRTPFARRLPEPDAPYLSLGYEFLSRYRIALDLEHDMLVLMAPS